MKDLLEVQDEIDVACDLLKYLDMAFLDVELEIRSPLETVLSIALRQLQQASKTIRDIRRDGLTSGCQTLG